MDRDNTDDIDLHEDLTMFRWVGENPLWDKVITVMNAHINAANNYATMPQQKDNERSFYCGELNGLQDIKEHLMELHAKANNPSGSVE
tara:strand:- start:424 stop:687 length:264 start_codon:yes stop_codon:yes gene_type:complete